VFFLYVYLVCLYVIGQFEHPVPRYVLPYLPALALTASLSTTMLIHAARERSRT
jgi:hypothetical protein